MVGQLEVQSRFLKQNKYLNFYVPNLVEVPIDTYFLRFPINNPAKIRLKLAWYKPTYTMNMTNPRGGINIYMKLT
jgi:hypothetical protein